MPMRAFTLLFLGLTLGAARAEVSEGERLYVEKIRALLSQKCMACHGDKPGKIKGEFGMLMREGLLKGGESEEPALGGE